MHVRWTRATVNWNLLHDPGVDIGLVEGLIATAIAGAYMNIPVAHTQGGEVSGSIDECPARDHQLSRLHFPATELSGRRVIAMGEDPRYVFNVGCPSIDLAARARPRVAPRRADRPLRWRFAERRRRQRRGRHRYPAVPRASFGQPLPVLLQSARRGFRPADDSLCLHYRQLVGGTARGRIPRHAGGQRRLAHGRYQRSNLFGCGTAGRDIADVLATTNPPVQKRLHYDSAALLGDRAEV